MPTNSHPLLEESVEEFRRDLRVLEREIARQLEGETACCDVTLTQCHALLELSGSDLSLTALAAALDLDTSTLSRVVDTMVQDGLLRRTADPRDRRSLRLSLARPGREKVRKITATCNRFYGALLGQFSEKERQDVVRGVRLLAQAI